MSPAQKAHIADAAQQLVDSWRDREPYPREVLDDVALLLQPGVPPCPVEMPEAS